MREPCVSQFRQCVQRRESCPKANSRGCGDSSAQPRLLRWRYHQLTRAHTPDSMSFRRFFAFFALTGVSPPASQKTKITRKIQSCQVQAVLPEQKSVQAMKSPRAILCVLARALRRHGRFSARQNRVCPCQLMVRFYMPSSCILHCRPSDPSA